jgi:hypothetical protein
MKRHIWGEARKRMREARVYRDIRDNDPRILNWLNEARAKDKRVELEEASPCGSSSALLSELSELGVVNVRHPSRRHVEAE